MQTTLVEKSIEGEEFYKAVSRDITQVLILFLSERGHGKALAIDTPIPTVDGWKNMENISVGDMVFNEKGNPCEVLAVSPIMYNHEVYEVEFDDGAKIKADKEHLWVTSTRNSRLAEYRRKTFGGKHHQPYESVKTTEEIKNTLTAQKGREINHAVKVSEALVLPNKELPIPPYTLGAWLGDGTSENGAITIYDEEILNRIKEDGFELKKWGERGYYNIIGLHHKLKENNLIKNKHIPSEYLRSSVEQRIELLKGLMDTDGTVSKDHNTSFCVTREKLAYDVSELIHSLGIRHRFIMHDAKIYGRYISKRYRFRFSTSLNLFNVIRKYDRIAQEKRRITRGRRYILNIKKIPTEPVKCITINSPSHLYLAGRQMIPTHNSSSLKNIVKRCMKDHPEIAWKCIDPSQTWYHVAPLKYRQFVTRQAIKEGKIKNVNDCVYEVGALTLLERRAFAGMIIAQDYKRAYDLRMNDPIGFSKLKFTVYIIEEANTIFNSYSFTAKDAISPILNDFVSVGRNYKLGAFLVGTAEDGEMAPSLRRRSRRIYGRLEAEGDLARIRRKDKELAHYLAAEIPRFNFIYYADKTYGPVHIKDTVTETPIDYTPKDAGNDPMRGEIGKELSFWMQFFIGVAAVLLFIAYFF